jgi:hypothetical protein
VIKTSLADELKFRYRQAKRTKAVIIPTDRAQWANTSRKPIVSSLILGGFTKCIVTSLSGARTIGTPTARRFLGNSANRFKFQPDIRIQSFGFRVATTL